MTSTISAADTAWVLICAALVMLMIPGLALFYGGLVRSRSSLNTFMMSLAPIGFVTLQWVLVGYSLAFAPGTSWLGGLSWAGFGGVGVTPNATYAATVPHLAFAAFQAMFATIPVALIAGAVVERLKFRAYLAFIILWATLVYDPLAHWVWGDGGWLKALGALDFAGGTVVHVSAGASALVAALVLGRRQDAGRAVIVPHNVPFTLVGAGLLWFGWFGFNAGSALAVGELATTAFVATHIAAASALATWVILDLVMAGRATAVGAATGAVVGLVAITPAAGYVTPLSAVAIGALGAGAAMAREDADRRRARRLRLSWRGRRRRRTPHGRLRVQGSEPCRREWPSPRQPGSRSDAAARRGGDDCARGRNDIPRAPRHSCGDGTARADRRRAAWTRRERAWRSSVSRRRHRRSRRAARASG